MNGSKFKMKSAKTIVILIIMHMFMLISDTGFPQNSLFHTMKLTEHRFIDTFKLHNNGSKIHHVTF